MRKGIDNMYILIYSLTAKIFVGKKEGKKYA